MGLPDVSRSSCRPWTDAPKLGTLVLNMGTDQLSSVLFSKTRRAVLALLYGHPEQAYYLRQIARQTRAGLGAVQRELQRLTAAGILRRQAQGMEVYYQANPACPVFPELHTLI